MENKIKQICDQLERLTAEGNDMTRKYSMLALATIELAQSLNELAAGFPNTGKNRNVFIKSYNRRPMNKKKRTNQLIKMALTTGMGITELEIIKSTPIQKYLPGSIQTDAIVHYHHAPEFLKDGARIIPTDITKYKNQ